MERREDRFPRAVVLVEGVSDQLALEALARRRGRDLGAEGVSIVPIGGSKNIGRFLDLFGPGGADVVLAGLCDAAEVGDYRGASNGPALGRTSAPTTWNDSVSSCAMPTSRTS